MIKLLSFMISFMTQQYQEQDFESKTWSTEYLKCIRGKLDIMN